MKEKDNPSRISKEKYHLEETREKIVKDINNLNVRNRIIELIIKKFHQLCESQRIKLLLVNIDIVSFPFLYTYCKKNNIPFLDLSNKLAEINQKRSLYFKIDPHYNPYAHKIIDELASEYLKGIISRPCYECFTYGEH